MSVNDITLYGGMRQNLANLQLIAALQARTTQRLSTGKRVNSAIDDPSAYFAAKDHMNHATDLAARKDSMGEAIQNVKAAMNGIDGINSLIEQAKGLAASARGANAADRTNLAAQFDELLNQIDQLAGDSGYRGTNFLTGDTLVVAFNEDSSSTLTITGFDATSTGLGITAAQNGWAADTDIDAAVTALNTATDTLRSNTKTLSSNLNVVTTRQQFAADLITTLTDGSAQLTEADQNEEGANMLALQTRQQLGITALSLSSQAQQSILKLF